MTAGTADVARVFFAVWPAPELQHALHEIAQRARSECGGRAVPARNIHLTLVFLGNVERARVAQVKAAAAAVAGAPCDLLIDRLEYWRHNRILWAGGGACPAALPALVAALCAGLRAIGFEPDSRPYIPHVTLLREARRRPADAAPAAIRWSVRDFALIESVARGRGREYDVLRRWPLRD